MNWWEHDPRFGKPGWCVIHDPHGTRFVYNEPRKRRRGGRALRFADLQPGAILVHRTKSTQMDGQRRGGAGANDDAPWVTHHHVGFAMVEDRWFDPYAGQDDPTAGQMATVRPLGRNGWAPMKNRHTLRGLASQGYSYATAEQGERVLAHIARCTELRQALEAGQMVLAEAKLQWPSWPALIRDLGLEPPPPAVDRDHDKRWV